MPRCKNCDAFITAQYVRVFAPDDSDTVRACPNCPDIVRDQGGVRTKRQ